MEPARGLIADAGRRVDKLKRLHLAGQPAGVLGVGQRQFLALERRDQPLHQAEFGRLGKHMGRDVDPHDLEIGHDGIAHTRRVRHNRRVFDLGLDLGLRNGPRGLPAVQKGHAAVGVEPHQHRKVHAPR